MATIIPPCLRTQVAILVAIRMNGGYRRSSRTADTSKEIHRIRLQVIIALCFPSCLLRLSHQINRRKTYENTDSEVF